MRNHSILREGAVAGIIGATVVAVWFLVVDMVSNELFHTPDLLGRSVLSIFGSTADDYDGLIDHARSIEGTRVAILFRETREGETKISFRSSSSADVNRVARAFGGGGHVKASGALIPAPPDETVDRVLDEVRDELRSRLASAG